MSQKLAPNPSPNQFYAGNHVYELTIGISDGYGTADALDTEFINMFSFSNRMNRLYNTGYIEYTDDKAVVDKFIHSDMSFVSVTFSKKEYKTSGDVKKQFTAYETNLKFLIDSVEIMANEKSCIKYRLNLVSESYLFMNQNARISTYGGDKKSPTTLIKEILENNIGMNINTPSFESNGSKTVINYITNDNDDGYSAVKYLLNRTIYHKDQTDTSLKALLYDQETNTVFLFDTKYDAAKQGVYDPIEIQVMKNSKFPGYQAPTKIGYVHSRSKIDSIVHTQGMEYVKYDMESNSFASTNMENVEILNKLNGGEKSRARMGRTLSTKYGRYETEWNNNIDLYQTMFDSITRTNGLITNQDGKMGAMAGYTCEVTIPNNFQTLNSKKNEVSQEKSKYQTITGQWDIYEVENYISPVEGIFRQKLVLYRSMTI